RLRDLSAIAVTVGPGLVGSLLVGLTYAKSLSFVTGVPLIGVNHIEGHIHAVILEARRDGAPVEFPALALVASGGHTHLFEVRADGGYRLLGKTRDDAAGEAFDKVGKLLGLGYPGGPVIDELLTRAAAAAASIGARGVIVAGGVACNAGLRAAARSGSMHYPVHFPSPGLSTDNAAMIAAAAFPKLERGQFPTLDIGAHATRPLA